MVSSIGTDAVTKKDEFSDKFQTVFDSCPSFLKNHVAIFFLNFVLKKPCLKVQNTQHRNLD